VLGLRLCEQRTGVLGGDEYVRRAAGWQAPLWGEGQVMVMWDERWVRRLKLRGG
jgi:hypothetical protein